jgi:hypothetical protein
MGHGRLFHASGGQTLHSHTPSPPSTPLVHSAHMDSPPTSTASTLSFPHPLDPRPSRPSAVLFRPCIPGIPWSTHSDSVFLPSFSSVQSVVNPLPLVVSSKTSPNPRSSSASIPSICGSLPSVYSGYSVVGHSDSAFHHPLHPRHPRLKTLHLRLSSQTNKNRRKPGQHTTRPRRNIR